MGAVCCARCGSYYLHQLSPYPGNWGFLIGIALIARRKQLFFCVVFAEEKWLSQCLLLMKLFSSPLPRALPATGATGSPPAIGANGSPPATGIIGRRVGLRRHFWLPSGTIGRFLSYPGIHSCAHCIWPARPTEVVGS